MLLKKTGILHFYGVFYWILSSEVTVNTVFLKPQLNHFQSPQKKFKVIK